MSNPCAQRTLVKSPPEIWAEVSDVESLARHLGAFGEIRITRCEPETRVAWEGETASGTVELKASGWGTKVTLTAAGLAKTDAPSADASEAAADEEPLAGAWAASDRKVRDRYGCAGPIDAVPFADGPFVAIPEVVTAAVPEEIEAAGPLPRRGLVRRLRHWLARSAALETSHDDALTFVPVLETLPASGLEAPIRSADHESASPSTGETSVAKPVPAVDDGEIVGILTGVLDELGAAHHRPFSRG